jgi:hypothetical protein
MTVMGEVVPGSAVSQAQGMLSQRLARNPGQLFISLLPGGQPPQGRGYVQPRGTAGGTDGCRVIV